MHRISPTCGPCNLAGINHDLQDFLFLLIIQNPAIASTDYLAPPVASVNCSMCSSLLVKTNYNTKKAAPPVLEVSFSFVSFVNDDLSIGGLGLCVVGLWAGWSERRTSTSKLNEVADLQGEFTLTTKELTSTDNREKNLTGLEIEPNSSLPLFHSPHALLGLLTLGCVALQMVMGKIYVWCNVLPVCKRSFFAGIFVLIFPCFGRTRSSYLPLHTFFGLALFIRFLLKFYENFVSYEALGL